VEDVARQPVAVLLSENLEDVREVLSEALSGAGYRVLTASSVSGAEAVREAIGFSALDLDLRHDLLMPPGPSTSASKVTQQKSRFS
jgi:CheY-like chemotaxis protein